METDVPKANEIDSPDLQKTGTIFASLNEEGKILMVVGDLTIEFCPAPDESAEQALEDLNRIILANLAQLPAGPGIQ